MTVLPGTETRSRPEVPRPDGRTDIPVFFQDIREEHDEQDPHAIIECKRVAGNDARLCRLYVVEGIDRFSTGKYAANHAVGFMAGYLLAGDAGSAAAGVNRHLTRKGRQSERLVSATFPTLPGSEAAVIRVRRPRPSISITRSSASDRNRPEAPGGPP